MLPASFTNACKRYAGIFGNVTSQRRIHIKRTPRVKVELLEDVHKLGRKGDVVSVARGHMRGFLFPQRQAKYVMKRVGVRKDHSKKDESDSEEMKYLKFKNIKLLPGIKEADCSPLRSHQLQVNLAVLNHLPDLVFKKISIATEEDTRAISGSVTIQDVMDKLAQYGVKLERGNIIWPMGTDDITQSGEYRCVFTFPEFRMRIAKKLVVRGLKSKKPEKKTRVKLSKEA